MMQGLEQKVSKALGNVVLTRKCGRVVAVQGLLVEIEGLKLCLGELVEIIPQSGMQAILAEVVALKNERALAMPYSPLEGISLESEVVTTGAKASLPVGNGFLGRVVNARGVPIDDGAAISPVAGYVDRHAAPINPLHRAPIVSQLHTGIKAIDVFVPLGRGQRIGVFAGSGVGKSTLLGMICRQTDADVIVLALIGERGREVADFVTDNLQAERRVRTVVVAASADQPAVMRKQSAFTATCIAEWFRDQGQNVLLVMDSITRLVMAQREIALAAGEPVGARGYPASSLALLPPLVERAGQVVGKGSITAIYTVLVEGDDLNDPVADHMRAILDGHVVLSRSLAERDHYPPVDVLKSVSRLSGRLWSSSMAGFCSTARKALAHYEAHSDFIELGAYQAGANHELDRAISVRDHVNAFLRQSPDEMVEAGALDSAVLGVMRKMDGRR